MNYPRNDAQKIANANFEPALRAASSTPDDSLLDELFFFIEDHSTIDYEGSADLSEGELRLVIDELIDSEPLECLIHFFVKSPIYSAELAEEFRAANALDGLPAMRALRTSLSLSLGQFLQHLVTLIRSVNMEAAEPWESLSDRVLQSNSSEKKMIELLRNSALGVSYQELALALVAQQPHAIYPTSPFRESGGNVVSSTDFRQVEASMSLKTYTSIRIEEGVLKPENRTLRDVYKPLGRCVCLVDQNVEEHFGPEIDAYFSHHGIVFEKLVYRAMEVDKGIGTVEKMLGDFKRLGVSRNEPVLVIGGGVLSDTGGLACSLYHRGTPYVMLSTSLVAGIDAGPSPRTCCDGFGYKNLLGAYHTPMLSITDRTMFRTLRSGWLRHGIAEIIKMAVVKDMELFEDLEQGGQRLIETRFGSLNAGEATNDCEINNLSQRILGRAIKSYVEAEYGNLYETHQCRPHAFGHTWSPGFEIPAGLLHGHAVSVGMGFGSYQALRQGWISEEQFKRIANLISSFDLSLWHPILDEQHLLWEAQLRMTEKRGGNLAAPLPKGSIGQCGYLNEVKEAELLKSLNDYKLLCRNFARNGQGIEVHCKDVGLEDPATVGCGC